MRVWNEQSSYQELQLLKEHFVLCERERGYDREKVELIENSVIELIREGKLIGELREGDKEVRIKRV